MSATAIRRMPTWRSLLWVGVIGSVLAWAWAWYLGHGAFAVMLLFAMAATAVAFRATSGMRWALVAEMVAGFAMFLASLYWFYLVVFVAGRQASVVDVVSASVFPMVAAAVLLLGSVAGFRHRELVELTPPTS